MDDHVASYIVRFYTQFMTAQEKQVQKDLRFLLKLEPEDGRTRGEDSCDLQRQDTQRLSRRFR
jgi:hypothetical protein